MISIRGKALRDGADMLSGFDQNQDDWPSENKMDRATIRKCCAALRAMADAADERIHPTAGKSQ